MSCDLSAHIKPGDAKCDQYRRTYSQTCQDCTKIKRKLSVIDGGNVAAFSQCSVEGCLSTVHARGMCWKHERSELGIDPSTGKPLKDKSPLKRGRKAGVKMTPHKVAKPNATPAATDDMAREIDALFAKKRTEWLEDLAGATSIVSKAKMFTGMVIHLEGMAY